MNNLKYAGPAEINWWWQYSTEFTFGRLRLFLKIYTEKGKTLRKNGLDLGYEGVKRFWTLPNVCIPDALIT